MMLGVCCGSFYVVGSSGCGGEFQTWRIWESFYYSLVFVVGIIVVGVVVVGVGAREE